MFFFPLFQIEDEKACSYDYVDIFGGLDDYSGPLYGRYCGINVSKKVKTGIHLNSFF